jgi:hypothetical protein
LYHSAECRKKARRLRHGHRDADTADLPPVPATPDDPAADVAATAESATEKPAITESAAESAAAPAIEPDAAEPAAAELAAAELAAAGLAAAELPDGAELPGSAAGHDAVSPPEGHGGADADEQPGDSEFWKPDNLEGFWEADKDLPHRGPRSPKPARPPGRHRSIVSQRARLKRSHTAAIAFTLAASAAGLGLIFSQPGAHHHPLTSDALHQRSVGATHPASSSSSPSGHTRTHHHAPGHGAGGTSHAHHPHATGPAPTPTGSSAPAPTPSRTSSRPKPKPSHSARPKPKPKRTRAVPSGLISFEDGRDGWKTAFGHISISRTTEVAYSGSYSLMITVRGAVTGIGLTNGSVAHLRPGDVMTYHIWSDGQKHSDVLPWAQEYPGPEDWTETVPLPTHPGWFTLRWTVPSGVYPVNAIGLQFHHNAKGALHVAIDALSWPGS